MLQKRCLFVLWVLVVAAGVVLVLTPTSLAQPQATRPSKAVYPGKTWAPKKPREVGLDPAGLEDFSKYLGGRGCVVRHGHMVYTWGDQSSRQDVASAAKPVYAHFLFKAVENDRIPSLDTRVKDFEPCLNDINADLGYKDRKITFRHMANQTSCYGVREDPGTAFDYNDWQMALFIDTLFLKVYGTTWEKMDADVLHPLLTDLLQCQDHPTFMAFGTRDRPGRFGISVRDFARFGLLYLRGGNWKGKQLISRAHVTMATTSPLPNSIPRTAAEKAELCPGQRTLGSRRIPDNQTDHLGSYSWLWWTNGVDRHGKRLWPDAPKDTYGAFGHGQGMRAVVVIPSLDMIISWNDTKLGRRSGNPRNEAFKLLMGAVLDKRAAKGLHLENGWFVHGDRVIWGYAQHNGWWRTGQRANLTRRAPGELGPNRTEDLDKLTDNMLRHGYPGFEHNFGLWYDRRRDRHDTDRRGDANVVAPFLEQPWARSDVGTAWDGLPKYDLSKYNPWYFDRLKTFASLCDRKGTILFYNFYMQHALLETNAHYVDFPWRPVNCIQKTDLPDGTPAANVFYDVTHPMRRELHRAYIRKCLDELGDYTNVVYLTSEEYTGPLSFMQFWLEVVSEWEKEKGKDVLVALSGTKDVLGALADDHRVSVLDLRYWWYKPDGSLYAPEGGRQVPGRYASARTTAPQVYHQVREYRLRYPHKGLIHRMEASRQQTWAFLMGGGSMLIRAMEYPGGKDPENYVAPADSHIIQPTYDFINSRLANHLFKAVPGNSLVSDPECAWCLAEADQMYLVYAPAGGRIKMNLSEASGTFRARWFDPRTGALRDADQSPATGGADITFTAPDTNDWVLWLAKQA